MKKIIILLLNFFVFANSFENNTRILTAWAGELLPHNKTLIPKNITHLRH